MYILCKKENNKNFIIDTKDGIIEEYSDSALESIQSNFNIRIKKDNRYGSIIDLHNDLIKAVLMNKLTDTNYLLKWYKQLLSLTELLKIPLPSRPFDMGLDIDYSDEMFLISLKPSKEILGVGDSFYYLLNSSGLFFIKIPDKFHLLMLNKIRFEGAGLNIYLYESSGSDFTIHLLRYNKFGSLFNESKISLSAF